MQAVSLSFYRYGPVAARLWAFGMMGAARLALPTVPDIGFWKLFGSGTGEGFTPIPNTAVSAILCTWPSAAVAWHRLGHAPIFRRYDEMAEERFTVLLSAVSSRGRWSGQEPFEVEAAPAPVEGPIAVLTRATVKPKYATRFWRQVPDINPAIRADANVLFRIGIGEVPLVQQVTFSIWPDAKAMHAFAHADGPHARAVKHVRAEGWFREELYARFRILGSEGTWYGRDPLERATVETEEAAYA